MQHSTLLTKTTKVISAAAIVLVAGLYSCNDSKKETETTVIDTPTVMTPPVIVPDSMTGKDSLTVIDTTGTKTEQTPAPRGH